MGLSQEEKEKLATYLRGTNVAKEFITEEYRKNLELADRREIKVKASEEDEIACYVFEAKNRTDNCPVFINIHGGGFVRPHVERDEIFSARIADAIRGIVVDVDYKLAPEYPFPYAFDECYAVARYVFAHAEEWNADGSRISIGGHSAGANLAAAVSLKSVQTKEFQFCRQVLDYGAFDVYTDPAEKPEAQDNMIPAERGRMFFMAYTQGNMEIASNPYCSPLAATDEMLRNLPETLIISAGKDNFRFEDHEFGRRLALAGVTVTQKCFLDSYHGFIVHCTEQWKEGQELVIEYLKS